MFEIKILKLKNAAQEKSQAAFNDLELIIFQLKYRTEPKIKP